MTARRAMVERALADWLRRTSVMAGAGQATGPGHQYDADRGRRGDRGETTVVRSGTIAVPRSPAGSARSMPMPGSVPLSELGRLYGAGRYGPGSAGAEVASWTALHDGKLCRSLL